MTSRFPTPKRHKGDIERHKGDIALFDVLGSEMLHVPHFLQQANGFYSHMGCELLITAKRSGRGSSQTSIGSTKGPHQ